MLNQPSVIARLMGMEGAIPVPTRADAIPVAMIRSSETINLLKPSSSEASIKLTSQFKQSKCSPLSHHSRNGDYYRYCLNKMRPRSARRLRHHHRHHPQEELLDKIKEDFQAWQTSKAPENALATVAGASGRSSNPSIDGRYIQMIAQENLRKEKMARYGYGGKRKVEDKVVTVENLAKQEGNSEVAAAHVAKPEERVMKVVTVIDHCGEAEKFFRGSEPTKGEHDDHTSSVSEKLRGAPTRIAILRPSACGTDADDHRGSVFCTTPKAKRGGDMEEFLQEVKERLKNEMKMRTGSDPKHTARDMAKQIRERIMAKDLGKKLSRLESFRVFRGDRRRDAAARHASPEHRMLKSIIARTETMSPRKIKQGLIGSLPVKIRGRRVRSLTDASGYDDQQSYTGEQQCLTKLHKVGDTDVVAVSPRALVRSFSAPASSGIFRVRHGTSDTSSEGAEVISRSSSLSLLRGTVSSLRHSFSLGGKLLLMNWSKKPSSSPLDSGHFTVSQGNFFTGLPPSPVSPLEVEGHSSRHFSSDLNCSFPELSPKCSSEFDAPMNESSWKTSAAAADAESNPDKAYVREVLITAGLCDDYDDVSSEDMAIGRTDSMARPIIGDDVFDEVEEAYYYRRSDKNAEEHGTDHHRMLFDLVNEALRALVRRSARGAGSSSLRRWVVDGGGGNGVSSLCGRELEDDVWRQVVQAMGDAPVTQTVDGMVECEVGRSPWIEVLLQEDVYVVGRKIERAILDELIADVFV